MGFFTNLKDFFLKLVFLLLPFATLLPMVLSYLHDVVGISLTWGFLIFIIVFFTTPLLILIYWIVQQKRRKVSLLEDSPLRLDHVLNATVTMFVITVFSFIFLYLDWVSMIYLVISGVGFLGLALWLAFLPGFKWAKNFDIDVVVKKKKEEEKANAGDWQMSSLKNEYWIFLGLTALLLLFYLHKNGIALYDVDRRSYNRAFYLEKTKPADKIWKIVDERELMYKRRFAKEDIRYAAFSLNGQTIELMKDSVYRNAFERGQEADRTLALFANRKRRSLDPVYRQAEVAKRMADSILSALSQQRKEEDISSRIAIVHWIDYKDSSIKAVGDFFKRSKLSLPDSADFYFDSSTVITFRSLLDKMRFDSKLQAELFFNALRKEVGVLDKSVKEQYQQSWKDILAGVQLRVVLLNGMMIMLLAGLLYCLSHESLASKRRKMVIEASNFEGDVTLNSEELPRDIRVSQEHDSGAKKGDELSPSEKAADFIRNLIILHIAILICVLKVVKAEDITGPDQFWMFRLQELISPAEDEKIRDEVRSDTSFYGLLRDTRNRVELIEQMAHQSLNDVNAIRKRMDSLPSIPELDRKLNAVKAHSQDLIR